MTPLLGAFSGSPSSADLVFILVHGPNRRGLGDGRNAEGIAKCHSADWGSREGIRWQITKNDQLPERKYLTKIIMITENQNWLYFVGRSSEAIYSCKLSQPESFKKIGKIG